MSKYVLIVGLAIALWVAIFLSIEVKMDESKFKCDVFTATVNNSGQEMAKVTIQDDRFVDGTKVEVEICGESYKVKPLDE